MTIVLLFVIFYMALSAWDVVRVNKLMDNIVTQGPRKQAKQLPPAPRLNINLPPR
ncbi:MAG TPA: hypothetical protein VJ782_00110 [Aeromicrobium sp.]|nr:hypothetical protein [Aeromicrobium sp.]